MDLELSLHALARIGQRKLRKTDVDIVVTYGRLIHRTGVTFYFLGRRDLPKGRERVFERLVGTTILVKGESVITAYKNRTALSTIKKKGRRQLSKEELRQGRIVTRDWGAIR